MASIGLGVGIAHKSDCCLLCEWVLHSPQLSSSLAIQRQVPLVMEDDLELSEMVKKALEAKGVLAQIRVRDRNNGQSGSVPNISSHAHRPPVLFLDPRFSKSCRTPPPSERECASSQRVANRSKSSGTLSHVPRTSEGGYLSRMSLYVFYIRTNKPTSLLRSARPHTVCCLFCT